MKGKIHFWETLKSYGYEAIDLLFPNQRCMVCGRYGTGNYLCSSCRRKKAQLHWGRSCSACAAFVPPEHTLRRWCISEPPRYIENAKAIAPYEGHLRELLLALKYEGHTYLARGMGVLLVELVKEVYGDIPFDMVCAVPMTEATLIRRGYNQSLLLAQQVAYGLDLPCVDHLLTKRKDVVSQVMLGREGRIANMRDAILPTSENIAGKCILLVDDIFTTGATAYACGRNLKQMGAAGVWVVTVAAGKDQ